MGLKEVTFILWKRERSRRQNIVTKYNFVPLVFQAAQAGLDMLHIFAPTNLKHILSDIIVDVLTYYEEFLNRPDVQRAIHVKTMQYSYFNPVVERELKKETYHTSKLWLEVLLEHYGVLCYK